MNKKNKLVYILVIIILVFIWSNSLDSPQESYSKSSAVGEWAMKLLSKFFEHDDPFFIFFRTNVRKIAHFIEYLFLGTAVTAISIIHKKIKLQHLYNILSLSVIVAVIDEFIQMYTMRGSSVRDVIIDCSGYVTGMTIVLAISCVKSVIRKKRTTDEFY